MDLKEKNSLNFGIIIFFKFSLSNHFILETKKGNCPLKKKGNVERKMDD